MKVLDYLSLSYISAIMVEALTFCLGLVVLYIITTVASWLFVLIGAMAVIVASISFVLRGVVLSLQSICKRLLQSYDDGTEEERKKNHKHPRGEAGSVCYS